MRIKCVIHGENVSSTEKSFFKWSKMFVRAETFYMEKIFCENVFYPHLQQKKMKKKKKGFTHINLFTQRKSSHHQEDVFTRRKKCFIHGENVFTVEKSFHTW